jgi:hypothetical protein
LTGHQAGRLNVDWPEVCSSIPRFIAWHFLRSRHWRSSPPSHCTAIRRYSGYHNRRSVFQFAYLHDHNCGVSNSTEYPRARNLDSRQSVAYARAYPSYIHTTISQDGVALLEFWHRSQIATTNTLTTSTTITTTRSALRLSAALSTCHRNTEPTLTTRDRTPRPRLLRRPSTPRPSLLLHLTNYQHLQPFQRTQCRR